MGPLGYLHNLWVPYNIWHPQGGREILMYDKMLWCKYVIARLFYTNIIILNGLPTAKEHCSSGFGCSPLAPVLTEMTNGRWQRTAY